MANEIELKLALPENAQSLFLRHPLLKQAVSRHNGELLNLYYDTPTLDLHRKGIALRLRRVGRQGKEWLQTVKCAGKSAAGLTSRPEWETPYDGHFDFSPVSHENTRALLERPRIKGRLAPLFETNFRRLTYRFDPAPGVAIELAFDRGWIASAGRREAISEIELELIGGSIEHIYALAETLAQRLPLTPALLSKAERGYLLFHNKNPATAPFKATTPGLDAAMAPREAVQVIAFSCLEHLQHNHAGACADGDPEFIHQMRVATRRLRAAIRLFAPVLPATLDEQLLPALRELTTRLGHARDQDVLFEEIVAPVLAALPDEPRLAALAGMATERRFAARADALRLLQSPRYGQLLLLAGKSFQCLAGHNNQGAEPTGTDLFANLATLGDFAASRLKRLRKKVLRLAAEARTDDPVSLHQLRIGIKRLRYGLEFLTPLMRSRQANRLLELLGDTQDTLGQLNDLANAGRLLMDCAGDDARLREAVTLIGGWHGPRHAKLMAGIPTNLKQLRDFELPRLL
ncbi:MAG: CYTH and CHAD domain-containing protein [Rhodocyclaceae bacterium]|nr:CYTH and CHAD domain-containing protein [Rhodocyclaceae bacterium]